MPYDSEKGDQNYQPGDRQKCRDVKDVYWACLDKNNENEAKCIKERAEFDGSCIQQWVCWLDHIYKYLKLNLVSIRVDATITLKRTMWIN